MRSQGVLNPFGGGFPVTQVNYLFGRDALLPEESNQLGIAPVLLRE
jgi:hypothetical protein